LCGSNKAQKHHQEPVACRCRWLLQLTLQYWSQHAVSPSTLQHHVFKPKYFPLEQEFITAQLTHHAGQNSDCSDSTVEKPKRKRRKIKKKKKSSKKKFFSSSPSLEREREKEKVSRASSTTNL
jgi:hypothetical protein